MPRGIAAQSDALVDELIAADTVVIAAAMISFTIPSTLKTWIDYIARPGRTFSYSESGPKGLVTGKRVFLVVARGGVYSNRKQFDFQLPYLLHVLAFLGMTDVEVIDVEGTAFGPPAAERAVATAWPCRPGRSGAARGLDPTKEITMECFSEPSLAEVLSDPLVREVMDGIRWRRSQGTRGGARGDRRRSPPARAEAELPAGLIRPAARHRSAGRSLPLCRSADKGRASGPRVTVARNHPRSA